jgi:hypothetical protein
MKASPDVSKDQQKLMEKIAGEMRDVVPWTVRDINALQRDPSAERVNEFAKRFGATGASQTTTEAGSSHENPITPASRDDYLALPKGSWYRDKDGHVYQKASDAIH